ncbi:ATP-binding protein [Burkholderia aenigmatica]|uniref:ATP-binding protein n=1 Tax=Burkholderia aenigmatica TaxID=2015348 RepID=UPI001F30A154|nr:ATP-binding protein [Burkholderia aenigmatica]UKD17408.1 ATP-binding protein [Burkholderia aenigmatica]
MEKTQPEVDDPGIPDQQGTSTAASGPAGAHFEGQVAAFYLLAMLCGAPPRGLPGTTIDRIALQQANTGRPLDDVIVHAVDGAGKPAVLEIQVKRTITFTPADPVFRKVVGQIADAMRHPDFWTTQYGLAIATARGSRKIDGPYQDVLALARHIGDAETFISQLKLPGVANDDMRTFVKTLQGHLKEEGAPHDDETTWKLLRRLQILTFDFTAPGSASEDLARERALRTLHADDASRVDAFWGNLVELAISVAKNGGDRSRTTLLESLHPRGFRFAADRRHASALAALAEHARQALADIDNHVGQVVLTRHERVAAVHEAFDAGRYVELRGDAGVGKSGVLRQVAESLWSEGQVLVLSPGRCVPRSWTAMRAQIGFEGTARELLVELANNGGAIVFVDNLDSFSGEERLTVVDMLRAAVDVPGVSVLATARTEFGVEESSWLPEDALDRLKRASPVMIDALSKAEIEQLANSDPALSPLLSENHPARQVTRNLFRLARIASKPAADPLPHTEAEMANQWWSTADGERDTGWRDRARLLSDLARQTFTGSDGLDVSPQPAQSIDALVQSGTLRSLGPDRVSFRHDVLREWAIACALRADVSLIDRLDLKRPAVATFARGIELAARMMVERATDGSEWNSFLERLSGDGAHKSWRRAVTLALARSEAGEAVLPRVQPVLFANQALLLRELLRTVMAVEVVPASTAFAAAGVDPNLIPAGMTIPKGPAWLALVLWLLSIGDGVPAEAIPEVVDLYTGFSIGTLGLTPITPLTTRQLYRWLRLMEPGSGPLGPNEGPRFWEGFERDQVQSVRRNLRNGFIMFARTTPDLAAEYLRAVAQSEHNDDLVRSILKMRGTLAQAAPTELARLTEQALIEKPRPRHRRFHDEREEAFTFVDHEFLPASPAQGPFFELLLHSPADGLALIHRLVDHAIAHGTRGRDAGNDAISLAYADGARVFPWTGTYFWSRNSDYYAITSALMALEAWAHHRVEAGEPFDAVLKDVLGPPASCAAYLLVAVDLIISHWPKSAKSAAEFLGCPELLCLDHTRQVHDQLETPDFLGLEALQTEPCGTVSAAELKKRLSRRVTLDGLIGNYALSVESEQLQKLTGLLRDAADRLGPAGAQANLGDPDYMVLHALNLADPANWHEVDMQRRDGSTVKVLQYVSPATEQSHLQALQDAAAAKSSDFAMQSAITLGIDNPSRFSPEQLQAAVAWASRSAPEPTASADDDGDDASPNMRREAVLAAAMMVMRDGDASLLDAHGDWARAQLQDALASDGHDPVHQIRAGLRFNPVAIAYTGLIYALVHRNTQEDVRVLLAVAAEGHHAAAHGFGAAIEALLRVDERLPRALLRCALRACIVPARKWDISEEEKTARGERRKVAAATAVDAEMVWLEGAGPEPAWPAFPKAHIRPRRRLRLPVAPMQFEDPTGVEELPSEEEVYHQTAALWLRQVQALGNVDKFPWLRDVANAYMSWTIAANGGDLVDGEETDDTPSEWNNVFFALTARCTVGLSATEAADLVRPIAALPEQNFFDVLADFLRSFDAVYFGDGNVDASVAIAVRSRFADRMIDSWGWKRLKGTKETSIERQIAPAIATLFFNDYNFVAPTKSYLLERGVERLGPFLTVLARLTLSGPSPFVALVLLNLLEVAPRAEHLGLLVQAGKIWLSTYPDFRSFWIDHEFGKRWCEIVERIHTLDPAAIDADAAIRADVDSTMAELVGLGVPEANRLEELLSGPSGR